jgi:hypothetical protein
MMIMVVVVLVVMMMMYLDEIFLAIQCAASQR